MRRVRRMKAFQPSRLIHQGRGYARTVRRQAEGDAAGAQPQLSQAELEEKMKDPEARSHSSIQKHDTYACIALPAGRGQGD